MRLRLLDVNVLPALAWPNHPFHEISRVWFVRTAKHGWASCLHHQLLQLLRLRSSPCLLLQFLNFLGGFAFRKIFVDVFSRFRRQRM